MIKKLTLILLLFINWNGLVQAVETPARNIPTDCSTWNKNLNCTMINQQLVDNAVDQLTGGIAPPGINWNQIGGIQTDIGVAGFNWQSLSGLNTSSINWQNILFSNLGINWSTVTNVGTLPWSTGSVTSIATASPLTGGPITSTGTIGLNYDNASLITSGGQLEVNWPNMTELNATGVNWTSFYPTSNPFNYLKGVNWNQIGGLQTSVNVAGFNWQSLSGLNTSGVNWVGASLIVNGSNTYNIDTVPVIRAQTALNNYYFGGSGNNTGTGVYNTAVGYHNLAINSTGSNNVAMGDFALAANGTGIQNMAIGYGALYSNVSGSNNVAIGQATMEASGNSVNNDTAIGNDALLYDAGGSNTGIGSAALFYITGANNTSIGYFSGVYDSAAAANETSSNSIYLGYQAYPKTTGDTNETVIGYDAVGNGSNTTTIGNSSTTGTIIPAGSLYVPSLDISTSPGASAPVVNITGTPYTGGSGTTTEPYVLFQPTGTTPITNWNIAGTVIGGNFPSSFSGNFIDYRVNGIPYLQYGNQLLSVGGEILASSNIVAGTLNVYAWDNSSQIASPSNGVIELNNSAGGFTRLDAGGTTSGFPALGFTTSPNTVTVENADGSSGANLSTGNGSLTSSNINWQSIGNLNSTSGINWNNNTLNYMGINWSTYKDLGAQTVNWYDVNLLLNNATGQTGTIGSISFCNAAGTNCVRESANTSLNNTYGINWSAIAPVTGQFPLFGDSLGDVNWQTLANIAPSINWSNLAGYATGNCLGATTGGGVNWTACGSGGGGSQTPWTSNINGAGYQLQDAGINWDTSFPIATNNSINWYDMNLILQSATVNGPVTSYNSNGAFNNQPTQYTGLVATRGLIPDQYNATNQQLMSRSVQFSTQNITQLKIGIPNYYLSNVGSLYPETPTGTSATVYASVEYPAGTFTQITFNGNASGVIPSGGTIISDYASVSIPASTQFWIRIYFVSAGGGIVFEDTNPTSALGGAFLTGVSGVPNLTLSGSMSGDVSNINLSPVAIIGPTNNPSVVIVGDSRCEGLQDTTTDATGNYGDITKSLGFNYGYISECRSSDSASSFLTPGYSTQRQLLWQYATYVIDAYGSNDIWALNLTAVQTQVEIQSIQALGQAQNKKVINITIAPRTTSTDNWETTANQTSDGSGTEAIAIAFNTWVRTQNNGQDGYFDIDLAESSSFNSGLWAVNGTSFWYTADGVHESSNGNQLLKASGTIPPNFAQTMLYNKNGNPSFPYGIANFPTNGINWTDISNIPTSAINWTAAPGNTVNYVWTNTGSGANWQASIGGGSGGGMFNYSDNGVTLSGTTYAPIGGGGAPNSTEASVNIKSPSATTVSNLQVNLSAVPGTSNSVAVTLRDGGSSQSLTCTVGASATSCQDLTHSFSVAQNDLIDWQIVTTGSLVGTPTVTISANNGTSNVGVTSVTASSPLASSGGTTPNITVTSSTGSGAIVEATAPTITNLTLAAGTSTVAPLTVNAGTNMTTPSAGKVENDGNNLYFTPFGSSRGGIPALQMMALTSNNTMSSDAAQPIFQVGSSSTGGVTLNSTTTYYFEMELYITGMSTSSGTANLTFATTGTIGSIGYFSTGEHTTAANTLSASPTPVYVNQTSATSVISNSTTTTAAIYATGIIRMTSTGTVTPEISFSQASTPTIAANSYFKIYPIGSNTTSTVGNVV